MRKCFVYAENFTFFFLHLRSYHLKNYTENNFNKFYEHSFIGTMNWINAIYLKFWAQTLYDDEMHQQRHFIYFWLVICYFSFSFAYMVGFFFSFSTHVCATVHCIHVFGMVNDIRFVILILRIEIYHMNKDAIIKNLFH